MNLKQFSKINIDAIGDRTELNQLTLDLIRGRDLFIEKFGKKGNGYRRYSALLKLSGKVFLEKFASKQELEHIRKGESNLGSLKRKLYKTQIRTSKDESKVFVFNEEIQFLARDAKYIDIRLSKISKDFATFNGYIGSKIFQKDGVTGRCWFVSGDPSKNIFMHYTDVILNKKLDNVYKRQEKIIKSVCFKYFAKRYLDSLPKELYSCLFPYKLGLVILDRLKKVDTDLLVLAEQLKKDGLLHLTPIVFLFNKAPKEAKEILGKSTWKKLANNSKTRNKLILDVMSNPPYNRKYDIETIAMMPSTFLLELLKDNYTKNIVDARLMRYLATQKIKIKNWNDALNLIIDTNSMGLRVVDNKRTPFFLLKHNLPKIRRIHDRLTREQNRLEGERIAAINQEYRKNFLRNSSDEILNNDSTFKEKFVIENNIVIEPINTGKKLLEEGNKQNHCIFNYVNEIRLGKCFVFHISNNGKKSTLMVDPKMNVMQHYGKRNSKPVAIKGLKALLVRFCNKGYRERVA